MELKSKKKFVLDTDTLHTDILIKLNRMKKSKEDFATEVKTSKRTLWKIGRNKTIRFDTFFKLTEWLNKDPRKYIITKPKQKKKCTTSL